MLKTEDIVKAINRLVVQDLDPEAVYINRVPKDFARPSYLIETVSAKDGDINLAAVGSIRFLTVTGFPPVDARRNAADYALMEMQDGIMGLFRTGYLAVGDRALRVKSSAGGTDFDRAYVDLQVEFADDRGDAQEPVPGAYRIVTNIKINKE